MRPSAEKIADIISSRRPVYGLEMDSRIRQAANRITARALFELLGQLDDESDDFASQLSRSLAVAPVEEVSGVIIFGTGNIPRVEVAPEPTHQPEAPAEYYLRLIFRNEDAAYYQFPLFPDLMPDYVLGSSRKRSGAVQHIRLQLARPETLQWFIEACRANPHLLRVEESTAEEFERAPSNAI